MRKLSLKKIHLRSYLNKNRHAFLWGAVTLSLVLVGLFLRAYHLTSRSLWLDEALCVKIAAIKNLGEMLHAVINEIHPPLFYVFLHFWMLLFENTDLSVRLFTVVWGCIGICGIYFFCRYGLNWSREASNLATLFAIVLPIHAYYSQEVRPYSMLFALSCFALGFLFRAHSKMNMRFYILFGVFQALILYVHHTALIYCFLINFLYMFVLLLYKQINWFRLKGLLLSGITSFLIYLPWLPFLFKQLKNPILFRGFWFWIPQPKPADLLNVWGKTIGWWKLDLGVSIPGFLHFIFMIPIFFLLSRGLFYAAKNRRGGESVAALAIIAYPLFIYFLSHVVLPVWLIRILVPSAVGVPIIAAFGIKTSHFKLKQGSLLMGLIVLFVSISLFTSLNLLHTYEKQDWRGGAKFLSDSVQKEDAVLVYRHFYSIPLERYLPPGIDIKEVEVSRESQREDLSQKLVQKVMALSGDSEKTYLVFASSEVPPDKLLSLINKTHELRERKSFHGFEILVFQAFSKI